MGVGSQCGWRWKVAGKCLRINNKLIINNKQVVELDL